MIERGGANHLKSAGGFLEKIKEIRGECVTWVGDEEGRREGKEDKGKRGVEGHVGSSKVPLEF